MKVFIISCILTVVVSESARDTGGYLPSRYSAAKLPTTNYYTDRVKSYRVSSDPRLPHETDHFRQQGSVYRHPPQHHQHYSRPAVRTEPVYGRTTSPVVYREFLTEHNAPTKTEPALPVHGPDPAKSYVIPQHYREPHPINQHQPAVYRRYEPSRPVLPNQPIYSSERPYLPVQKVSHNEPVHHHRPTPSYIQQPPLNYYVKTESTVLKEARGRLVKNERHNSPSYELVEYDGGQHEYDHDNPYYIDTPLVFKEAAYREKAPLSYKDYSHVKPVPSLNSHSRPSVYAHQYFEPKAHHGEAYKSNPQVPLEQVTYAQVEPHVYSPVTPAVLYKESHPPRIQSEGVTYNKRRPSFDDEDQYEYKILYYVEPKPVFVPHYKPTYNPALQREQMKPAHYKDDDPKLEPGYERIHNPVYGEKELPLYEEPAYIVTSVENAQTSNSNNKKTNEHIVNEHFHPHTVAYLLHHPAVEHNGHARKPSSHDVVHDRTEHSPPYEEPVYISTTIENAKKTNSKKKTNEEIVNEYYRPPTVTYSHHPTVGHNEHAGKPLGNSAVHYQATEAPHYQEPVYISKTIENSKKSSSSKQTNEEIVSEYYSPPTVTYLHHPPVEHQEPIRNPSGYRVIHDHAARKGNKGNVETVYRSSPSYTRTLHA